jgi:hypothetical protein
MILPLSREVIALSLDYERQIMAHVADKRDYTGLEHPDRFYVGYLGELTLRDFLQGEHKSFIYVPRLDGYADDHDFIFCFRNGMTLSIDVKTASKKYHQLLAVPEMQFHRWRHDIYIGARLNSEEVHRQWMVGYAVEFHGWLSRLEMEMIRPEVGRMLILTRSYPLDQLRSMESLLAYL